MTQREYVDRVLINFNGSLPNSNLKDFIQIEETLVPNSSSSVAGNSIKILLLVSVLYDFFAKKRKIFYFLRIQPWSSLPIRVNPTKNLASSSTYIFILFRSGVFFSWDEVESKVYTEWRIIVCGVYGFIRPLREVKLFEYQLMRFFFFRSKKSTSVGGFYFSLSKKKKVEFDNKLLQNFFFPSSMSIICTRDRVGFEPRNFELSARSSTSLATLGPTLNSKFEYF